MRIPSARSSSKLTTSAFMLVLLLAGRATAVAQEAGAPTSQATQVTATQMAPGAPPAAIASSDTYSDEWYGHRIILTDLASVGVALASTLTDSENLSGGILLVGYLGGGPINHAIEGEWLRAAGSLSLRLGLPMVGGTIGLLAAGPCVEDGTGGFFGKCFLHGFGETLLGGMIGAATAVAIDWTILPRKRVAHHANGVGIVPTLGVSPNGGTVGLGGWF